MSSLISPVKIDLTTNNGLCIYAGSFWSLPVTIVSRENLVDTPVDLSGYTGKAVIKRNINDDTPVAVPTVEISQTNVGQFVVSLSSELSQNIPTVAVDSFADYSEYFYEVRFTDNLSGEEYRAMYGTVQVIAAVIDSDDHE